MTGAAPTTTVAVIGVPGHPFATGVIVNVTVTGEAVVFVNVPEISPLPLAAIPVTIAALSLVQLKVVPAVFPVNTIGVIAPEQTVCDAGVAIALGVGLTVTVAVDDIPGHPFAVAVIVNVTVTGAFVVLVNAPLISPLPFAAIPVTVAVLSLVQLNVEPAMELTGVIVVMVAPEQMVCGVIVVIVGVGSTVIVKSIGVPVHVVPALV